jgi:hypothetical protein
LTGKVLQDTEKYLTNSLFAHPGSADAI